MPTREKIKESLINLDSAKIFFADLNGKIMSLPVNPEHIESISENGIGFDGSSIAGLATIDKSDRILFPVPDSYRSVEFKNEKLGFFIGAIYNEKGKRAQSDPRAVLERVIAEAESECGCRFLVGPEHEFFILNVDEQGKPGHSDNAGYFHPGPHDKGEVIRNRIIRTLKSCGIEFEKTHHEVTPSQHEINLECTDPLGGADRTILFNYITQKVAAEYGYHASFMSKPFDGFNRNAFHIHISMYDLDGKNLFYGESDEYKLSPTARKFIGGILKYAREASILMASNFNSYKAYVIEREAPVIRGWGLSNRSSMVRIPYSGDPKSKRIELRNPDPSGNVYLQMAVLIAMGLRGLKDNLDCGAPDMGSVYNRKLGKSKLWDKRFLPKSMYEALVEAERSRFLKELLGARLYDSYMTLKTNDWENHRTHITPREHQQYL